MNKYKRHDANTREHVHIAERVLGRKLRGNEQVHHVDYDKSHNSNQNLVICPNKEYHTILHRRTDSLVAIGNPNGFRCCYCKLYDLPDKMSHITRLSGKQKGQVKHYHKECHNTYHRNRRMG